MKPLNINEINKSYQNFILNFINLIIISVFCIFIFLLASEHEYEILEKRVRQTDALFLRRKEINLLTDELLARFQQLSTYHTVSSESLNNQSILMGDIQNINFRIKDILKLYPSDAASFQLYQKMTDDITQMAAVQDSLNATKFQIENIRNQLETCLNANHRVEGKLKAGIFGH